MELAASVFTAGDSPMTQAWSGNGHRRKVEGTHTLTLDKKGRGD